MNTQQRLIQVRWQQRQRPVHLNPLCGSDPGATSLPGYFELEQQQAIVYFGGVEDPRRAGEKYNATLDVGCVTCTS